MNLRPSPTALLLAAVLAACCASQQATAAQPTAEGEAADPQPSNARQPYYVSTPFSFDDVDLATLERRLARFGFDLPFDVDGEMSVRLRVQWPLGALANRRAYRFQGTLTSDALQIAGLRLSDFSADLDYAEGILRLTELDFRIPDRMQENGAAARGQFRGAGSVAIWPRGELRADLQMTDVALETLIPLVPDFESRAAGRITGQITGSAPAEQLADPAAWAASGRVAVADFVTEDLPPLAADTRFQLTDGVLTLADLAASMKDAGLSGTARLELADPFPFRLDLGLAVNDAGLLNELGPVLDLPVDVTGRGRGTANVTGTVAEQSWTAQGRIRTEALKLDDVQLERVGFDYRVERDGAVLTLTNVAVAAYGGEARGEARWDSEQQLTGRFNWSRLQTGDLLAAVMDLPIELRAVSRGTVSVTAPADQLSDLTSWRASGTLAAGDASVEAIPAAVQRAQFTIAEGLLSLENMVARLAELPVELTGTLGITAPYDFRAAVRVRAADLAEVRTALLTSDDLALLSRLPDELAGTISTAASLEGTLQPLAVRGTGSLRSETLRLASMVVGPMEVRYALTPQHVTLNSFVARLAGGLVRGSARLPLEPETAGSLGMTWENVRIDPLVRDFLPAGFGVSGLSQGTLDATIPPPEALRDVNAWQAAGELRVTQIEALGAVAARANAKWRLADGKLALEQLTARVNAADVRLSGNMGLAAPFAYAADLRIENGELEQWNRLAERLDAPVQLAGRYAMSSTLSGSLEPFEVAGRGTGAASGVRLGELRVDQVNFAYELDPQQLRLSESRVELYGGRATASATLPLDAASAAALEVTWQEINLGDALDDVARLPVNLEGTVAGSLRADAEAGHARDWPEWTVDAQVRAPQLTANSVTLGQLEADLKQQARELTFSLAGQLMEGSVRASGRWFPVGDPRAAESEAQLQLSNLQLNRLGAMFPDSQRLAPLSGAVDARLDVEPQESGAPRLQGLLQVTRLQWGRTRLADRVQGQIVGDGRQIQLANFTGPFAQGRMRLAATIPIQRPRDTQWEFSLRAVRISEAMLLLWPEGASWAGGTMDLQLRGRAGNEWITAGAAALREASVSDVRVRGVRLPLRLRFDPNSGRGELVVQGGDGQLSGGRVTGAVRVRFTPEVFLEGDLKFTNLDLASLIRELNYSGRLGSGRINGSLTFKGERVQSLRDINGQLRATLRQTQAFSFPVLQQIRPYVAGVSGATSFERGEIEARMRRGVIFIEQLTFASPSLQMLAEGQVTPAGGLDLSVMASTSQLGQDTTLARRLLERLPLAAPAPVGLIMTANRYLADRVLYFDVGGTIRNPVVRIRPLPVVRDAVVRFFLEGAVQGL